MIKKILNKLIKKFNSPVLSRLDDLDKFEYLKQIERAYRAGYNYHQKQIKSDPELLSWITREHYFDD